MTAPTFEEFLTLAEDRLALAALAISDGATVGAATCAVLSTATRALITLGTRYGLTPHGTPVSDWQPAFTDQLTAADRRLRRHADPNAAPSTADELIGDVARLITVAQDVLATHLTVPDPPRQFARTPTGADLLDTATRERVLHRVAEVVGHLAQVTSTAAAFDDLTRQRPHLADAYLPRDRDLTQAAHELAAAAAQRPAPAGDPPQITTAPVMAAPVTYPPPQEDPAQAAEHVRDALDRLATAVYQAAHPLNTGEYPPAHTADNLGETAASLALAHVLAADLLTRLAPHLPPAAHWHPARAADQLRAAGATWARLRRPWEHTTSIPDSGPRNPLTIQAAGIPLRLGRLLYADPAWNPQHGPGQPRTLAELLEPHILDAACTAISALPRVAATIAANHGRLIADHRVDLHTTDRTHRPEGEARRFYPLQPTQRAELIAGYQEAAHVSKNAATGLVSLSRGYQALRAETLMTATHPTSNLRHTQSQRTHPTPQHQVTRRPITPS